MAAARSGRRVLVTSTDPAHSLGDAFGVRLSSRPTTVSCAPLKRGRTSSPGLLRAVELDAPRAFARWLAEHRRALGDILEHGTWLDRPDVEAFLGLSIPGIDELVGVLEIVRLASAVYDLIIVDTAPTGHALRLLSAPETVDTVASVLFELQREHRIVREQLARVARPEAGDRLIDLLSEQARQTAELLRDPVRSTFSWVMLPESLSLAETTDALVELEAHGLDVSTLVINRMLPDGLQCPICDRRRAQEREVLRQTTSTIGRHRTVRVIPGQLQEPRGVAALWVIGRVLFGEEPPRSSFARSRSRKPAGLAMSVSNDDASRARVAIASLRKVRLLLVGGKGGVGKSTIAAALGLAVARAQPARRVLLLSTDPAHSLGDALGESVVDEPMPIAGGPANLHVREVDARAELRARRAALEAAIDEIVTVPGTGSSGPGVRDLLDLAPPGIDELFGLVSVMDAFRAARHDLVIVDTAPTGHALRLLEMPVAAREWVQTLLRMLLKYRDLVRPGQLAAELLDLSKSIRDLQELLHAPKLAQFIVVTRPAVVPRLETERLLVRLKRLRLSVPLMLVNAMTLAPGRCAFCRSAAAAEARELGRLTRATRRIVRDCAIIQTPLAAPPPRGVEALDRWARTWMA